VSSAAPSFFTRLRNRAFAPVDIAALVWFRIAFGFLMIVEVQRFFANGWITRYFTEPGFLFKYYGFGWVHPLPDEGMKALFLGLGMLGFCIMAGFFYRVAAALFFLGFTYVFLLEQARYLNHFYLVCLYAFLIIFVPAHRAFSLDVLRRPSLRSATAPAWSLWLLRAQICVVFFFGGVAKLNPDWLAGEPMRMWLAKRVDFPVVGPYLVQDWAPWFFSYGGLAFDLLIVPFLLWRRTRWWAFIPVAIFNLINAWIFQIGIFPWLALGAIVLLFAPKLPHPVRALWTPVSPAPPEPPVSSSRRTLIVALVGAYLAFQFLVPLRHWLYAGDVMWTEEGHRFSWRMKLRDKEAKLALYAHDPDAGRTWRVTMANYITRPQYDEASGRPDMILQLAHHVADDFRKIGHTHVQIRARVTVSLNGRTEQLFLDPDVDLAAIPRDLGHATWIKDLLIPLSDRRPPRPAPGVAQPPAATTEGEGKSEGK
jgi:vitamin K-dependent gamma-carboxylase